jgi:predicted  nucleic acid-binding Zn-ribbon protein
MRQPEFDKINVALDRAEFALEELRKKASELCRKLASVKTAEETEALNRESIELKQQLRKIGEAVHAGSSAPHLRLVSDAE